MRSKSLIRSAVLAAAILIVARPETALGQKSKCGPAAELTGHLGLVANVFTATDSGFVGIRTQLGIAIPPPGAVQEVVTDSRTCNQLLGATRKAIRDLYGGGRDNPFNDSTFGFFRVGDYYVSLQLPAAPTGGIVVSGRVEFLIFRVSDQSFVGRLLA
ncbi:MAG: hypothetical protein Q8Q85_03790 [Gemmatimonadales bacterium]|nr:hypothetical protein [Gemmatimonadales bacterium]